MDSSSQTVKKTILLEAKPNSGEALHQALIALQAATRREPGCQSFTFYQALTEPDDFVLIEHFTDRQAYEAHMQLPHTKAFFAVELLANSRAFP